MNERSPTEELPTHHVLNQPPPFEGIDLFAADPVLQAGVRRERGGWALPRIAQFGAAVSAPAIWQAARDANRFPPELRLFDRFGHRLDEVDFHPAYHQLMALGLGAGIHSLPWAEPRAGAHVAHAALEYMLVQVEASVCCPITMTYAAVPALRQQPELAAHWLPGLLAADYDGRFLPAPEKRALTCGMAMTEKQGGSDVRANTSRAVSTDDHWRLTGHKWFCSAPMSDLFLTLAQAPAGLSCFAVPRWLPDGTRNVFRIQRLKDKLGDRANASAEIEYDGTAAWLVGEEGRGVNAIIEMVHHTRLDTCLAAAGLMRQAWLQATHHAMHRAAFGKLLIQQPLMRNVLADLALEAEAALQLTLRIARAYDDAAGAAPGSDAALLARLLVAVGKYWVNRRAPAAVFEALECLGGAGYIEESPLPRLYRQAPLNSIWEGSGNVICLDVLRTLQRSPHSAELLLAELAPAAQADARIGKLLATVHTLLGDTAALESQARLLVESIARALQSALMRQHAPAPIAEAFLRTRAAPSDGRAYGTLPAGIDCGAILCRYWPAVGDCAGLS